MWSSKTVNIPIKKITPPPPNQYVETEVDTEIQEQTQSVILEAYKQRDQIIADANQELEQTRANLQQELAQLKQVALEEATKLKQQAYEEGFSQGQEQGWQEGQQQAYQQYMEEANQKLERLSQTCFQAQQESERYIEDLTPELVKIIKLIAEKVTFQVMDESQTKLLPLLKSQLKELSRRKQLFIRVHPDSYEETKTYEATLQEFCVEAKLHFIADDTLSEFGCIIESESEIIDFQLDKQLKQLFTELERVVKEQ